MAIWLCIAAVVGYAAVRLPIGYPKPPARYRQLTRREAAFVAAAAQATFPRGGELAYSGLDADVPGYVDRLLDASHSRTRTLIRLLFFLVEHATFVFPAPGLGGMRRFSSLSSEQQAAVLEAWAGSRLVSRRLVFASLRALITMGYFAHPPLLRQLRLAPLALETPVCEADLLYPPIGSATSDIVYTADDLTPPSDGTPVDIDGPLHPRYSGGAS